MTARIRYSLIMTTCGVLATGGAGLDALSSHAPPDPRGGVRRASVSAVPVPEPETTSCLVLQLWAREHFARTPPTLTEIARYTPHTRRAIASVVTLEARSALWQNHFRRFSRARDLSDTQRALVIEAMTLLTPAYYRREPAAVERFDQFWKRAKPAFVTPRHKYAWYNVGSITPTGVVRIWPVKPTRGGINCNCSEDDDCGVGGDCGGGPCSAIFLCGPGGGEMCDGRCV